MDSRWGSLLLYAVWNGYVYGLEICQPVPNPLIEEVRSEAFPWHPHWSTTQLEVSHAVDRLIKSSSHGRRLPFGIDHMAVASGGAGCHPYHPEVV